MPKINIKFTPRTKRWLFIGIIIFALVFVFFQFNRNSEFRFAKKAFDNQEYARAAELFSALGTYSDSDSYVDYCLALDAFQKEDYEVALERFEQQKNFQKTAKYILYTKGMISYQKSKYWEAATYFEECSKSLIGTAKFLDSREKAQTCYYTSGWILETRGDYERAIVCYRLADDYNDAKTRLKECEDALKSGGNTPAYAG